jgi:hypothetical protein
MDFFAAEATKGTEGHRFDRPHLRAEPLRLALGGYRRGDGLAGQPAESHCPPSRVCGRPALPVGIPNATNAFVDGVPRERGTANGFRNTPPERSSGRPWIVSLQFCCRRASLQRKWQIREWPLQTLRMIVPPPPDSVVQLS